MIVIKAYKLRGVEEDHEMEDHVERSGHKGIWSMGI